MSFLTSLLGGGEWDLGRVRPPWGERPSLFQHVAAHLPQTGPGLRDDGYRLPDPEPRTEGGITWDPGGRDGSVRAAADPVKAARVLAALTALVLRAGDRPAAALYARIREWRALEYVDLLLPPAAALDRVRMRAVARWLAEGAADREAVKVGIALLGIAPGEDDRELLMTLARHDEFTLFAAKALTRGDPAPERALVEVGRLATGWGRIQVVRLLEGTRDEAARAWLLREGYRDTAPFDYTGLICARDGGLLEALRGPTPDDALLTGAGQILAALAGTWRLNEYADGEEAAELYVRPLARAAPSLDHALALKALLDWLEHDGEDDHYEEWEEDERETFPRWPARRAAILEAARAYLERPGWEAPMRGWLAADDRGVFDRAVKVAPRLGIDPWEACFDRVRRGLGSRREWPILLQDGDRERVRRALELADEVMDPDALATGPGFVIAVGPEYDAHDSLNHVLTALKRFPGSGWRMVAAGLRSPAMPGRNVALMTLAAWPRAAWPPAAEPALRAAHAAEPHDETRDRMGRLLAGERLKDFRFSSWPDGGPYYADDL